MTIDTILEQAPQKTFLIQANEAAFEILVATAIVQYPMTNAMNVPRFTMAHAKQVVEYINEGTGQTRIIICFFAIFSPDAAQVLLKSLEEPDRDTTIVLMTPYPYLVPATIRSRTRLIHSHSAEASRDTSQQEIGTPAGEARPSGKLSRDTLLAQIKEEFASDADEDAATRRAKAVEMLDMLEAYVRTTPQKAAIVYKAKDMLFAGNLPTKYVLEYAASMVL